VRYEFPTRGKRPPVTLHWYHASKGPDVLREKGIKGGGNTLFVGSEGMLLCDFGKRRLLPEKKFAGFEPPAKSIPDSPGFHCEWIQACKGGDRATCQFDYSGPMAETVLLGNVAYRAGTGFHWDAKKLEPSVKEVAKLIRPPFRKGWEVKGV